MTGHLSTVSGIFAISLQFHKQPAIWAALGLVDERFGGIELLLASRKKEGLAAITASKRLVCKSHWGREGFQEYIYHHPPTP